MKINKKGISLIVLVITIIVIIILVGAVILSLSSNNPISQASKATYLSDLKNFQTELELYQVKQFAENSGQYDPKLLKADGDSVTYNGIEDTSKNVNDIISSLVGNTKYNGQFEITNGELIYTGYDTNKQDWSTEAGVEVILTGEPIVTIVPPADTVVVQGTDIVYTIAFSSNAPLTTIDLTGKVEVLDNAGVALVPQPDITIGTVTGTAANSTRQVDITIATDGLTNGTYKIKVDSGSVTNEYGISNTIDKISLIGFDIVDIMPPDNPTMSADPDVWTNGNTSVTINYSADSVVKEYSTDATNWNNYTLPVVVTDNNTTVYARGKDSSGNESGVATITVTNIDRIAPTVTATSGATTSSSVIVNGVASDTGGSGLVATSYQYSKDNGTTWTTATTATSYLFDTLATGTYQCKVKVADNAGNTATSNAVGIGTQALTAVTMLASPSGWTNGNVSVTITYPSEVVTKQYSTDGTTWNIYTLPVVVSVNSTVYAKGLDAAGNQTAQATSTITNIDNTIPTVTFGTNSGSGDTASTTVTVSDVGGSNINASTLLYVWDTQNVVTPVAGWATFANGATLTKTSVTGTYYLWIKADDNAGNNVVNKTNGFILAPQVVVNAPVLATGMTAKKWNGTSWVTVSSPSTDTTWYSYGSKQWANAQTADGSMWVWLPRYEYKITTSHTNTAQTIAVNFLVGTSTTPTAGYTVHPAFTFGSTQLTGIWVAKFEASGTITAVDVKPNVTSLINITINSMFTACRSMETTYGARYGWGTSGTGIDTHLMKNVEWGSIAYLSNSIYGKNSEVWVNPNSNFVTGQAGTSVSCAGTTSTYAYNDLTYGVNASTTGNISGVYDMSGGAYEYTAAYVNNASVSLATYGNSLYTAAAQYKDVYTMGTTDTMVNNYTAAAGKKGDAVYETSNSASAATGAWYSDCSYMPSIGYPFFLRSMGYSDAATAGAFGFIYNDGNVDAYTGFRPVLAVSAGL